MSLKKTLILALVMLALGLYVFYGEMPREEAQSKEELLLGGISDKDISKLKVSNSQGQFELVSNGLDETGNPTWFLENPNGAAVESAPVSAIVNDLVSTKSEGSISKDEQESDLSVYGLKDPEFEFEISRVGESNESASVQVKLGKLNEFNHKRYASVTGKEDIFLISDDLGRSANKSKFDIRDKTPIEFVDGDVASIEIVGPNSDVKIDTQESTGWRIVKPIVAPAAYSAVAGVLRSLRDLTAVKFYETDGSDDSDFKNAQAQGFGLEKPQIESKVKFKESAKRKDLRIVIGKFTGESSDENKVGATQWSFKIDGSPTVYKIASDPSPQIIKNVINLREKRLFTLATENIESVKVTPLEGDPVVFEKGDALTGGWTVNGKAGDNVFVTSYFRDLSELEAVDFPEKEKTFSFEKPLIKIDVKLKTTPHSTRSERVLVVGSKVDDKYVAAVDDLTEPFYIDQARFSKISPKVDTLIKVEDIKVTPTNAPDLASPSDGK